MEIRLCGDSPKGVQSEKVTIRRVNVFFRILVIQTKRFCVFGKIFLRKLKGKKLLE